MVFSAFEGGIRGQRHGCRGRRTDGEGRRAIGDVCDEDEETCRCGRMTEVFSRFLSSVPRTDSRTVLDDFPRDCRSESAVFNPHRSVVSRHSRCVRVRECVRYVRGFANDANTRLDRMMLFFFLYVTLRPLRNRGEATRRRSA